MANSGWVFIFYGGVLLFLGKGVICYIFSFVGFGQRCLILLMANSGWALAFIFYECVLLFLRKVIVFLIFSFVGFTI